MDQRQKRQLGEIMHGEILRTGAVVEISQVLHFNQTLTLRVNGKDVILGALTAQYIFGE